MKKVFRYLTLSLVMFLCVTVSFGCSCSKSSEIVFNVVIENEDKSEEAEKLYEENIDDTYVKVRVHKGNMVIVGVYIGDNLIDNIA